MSEKTVEEAMKIAFANWVIVSESEYVQELVYGLFWSLLSGAGNSLDEFDAKDLTFSVAVICVDSGYIVVFTGTFKATDEQIDKLSQQMKPLINYLTECFKLWESSGENTELHKVDLRFNWLRFDSLNIHP